MIVLNNVPLPHLFAVMSKYMPAESVADAMRDLAMGAGSSHADAAPAPVKPRSAFLNDLQAEKLLASKGEGVRKIIGLILDGGGRTKVSKIFDLKLPSWDRWGPIGMTLGGLTRTLRVLLSDPTANLVVFDGWAVIPNRQDGTPDHSECEIAIDNPATLAALGKALGRP
jgi:hypothetical protein